MPVSMYEQFFAVGSVKSLVTGKNVTLRANAPKTPEKTQEKSGAPATSDRVGEKSS